jgi:glycerol-3-phosphate dehydrogenase
MPIGNPPTTSSSNDDGLPDFSSSPLLDVVVIGGGVVGLAVARAATLQGYHCAVLEGEADLLSWASGSNSGIACTGVDATPGSLERALIRDSIAQLPTFLQEMRVPHDATGSLVCHWPWDEQDKLEEVLAESHVAGDTHAQRLSAAQVLAKEPHLNPSVQGAVHIPGEIVVDPWLYSIALALQARENGALIYTLCPVDPTSLSWDGQEWTIPTSTHGSLRAKAVVCATGAWAADWEQSMDSRTDLQAAPRRGQYRVFQATSTTAIRHPLQPIPTQRTKGIFVFGSLYNQIVVGPTALDQDSKEDRSVDPAVTEELTRHACRLLPHLEPELQHVGSYVGIRPGTNQRDYQIRTRFAQHWITVAGIRSTGLTASLGIGRHVTHLLQQVLREAGIQRTPLATPHATPLPLLTDLIRDYQTRNDGCVEIHGNVYKVTHPVTQLGWQFGHPTKHL